MLQVGDKIPSFSLLTDSKESVSSKSLTGKKYILYFYPKDDTPGCTKEACGFQANYSKFKKKGVEVYGVSKDSVESHVKFKNKYDLEFPLISDPEVSLAKAFGAWGEKNMYGKKVFGIIRSTFVINEKGVIEAVYPKVKPEEHADEILKNL